jgi:hypothetical protein
MRLLKRDPHGPAADGSFKTLNCYEKGFFQKDAGNV